VTKMPPVVVQIPLTRKVRSDTDLQQFLLHDKQEIETAAAMWVRTTARTVRDEALDAGNPPHYSQEIDGATTGAGKVKRGRAFAAGSIDNATRSVRIQFVGGDLATIANNLKPQLLKLIAETFPQSRTKKLSSRWVWYVQLDGLLLGKRTASRRLGEHVPDSIGLYDVLWLAPEARQPAEYAWFANRLALGKFTQRFKRGRKPKLNNPKRRLRGFMAEATRRMRGTKSQQQAGPVIIQAMFIRQGVTAWAARAKRGVPVIRIAFKRSLTRSIQ
jgi:hypothetical protein